ncbi:major facilitator superfamily domain-containing protein 8 [Pungitius pungitius]|uniref:major facilitator superfamily domain-containing protein 8 n=1 Tax=Pungitius pungitius TaxID=134920 RepID=UPI002E101C96
MDNLQKRNLTFLTIGLIFMLNGIEYAVILPTIWKYLEILEAPPYFLGLGLSAFSLSGLLTGPLFGLWSDRSQTTKSIVLFSNLFEIAGNFMYFIGYSKWLLISSRLVAGVGAGAGSSIFGFLTRSTKPEERAGIFAAIMACRQAGLLVGPAFNLFLRLCDFKLGPFVVNKYTSPGIFMCLLWVLLQFAILALYRDVPPIGSEEGTAMLEMKREAGDEEEVPLIGSDEEPLPTYRAVNADQLEASTSSGMRPVRGASILGTCRELLREEVVVLLTAQFITLFNQTALETMVTPMTQRLFGFGELSNSLMYSLCGVEVILGFFFVRWLSRRVADRVVLAAGLVICCIACIWCLVFLCNPRGGYGWELSSFIIGVFLQLLGLPFVAVSQVSLFSKVTAEKTQGFSQGVRRSVGGLATILGPLWAGGLTNNLYIMLGMMLALLVMITVMTVLSYGRLTEPRAVHSAQSSDSGG